MPSGMIRITPSLVIDEKDISESFVRASGPGGQNVNKVSTAVELRFNIHTAELPDLLKERLIAISGKSLTQDGTIVIFAQSHRSQERNRAEALERLVQLLRKAAHRPKKRIATRPTKASKTRRLEAKAKRSQVKNLRQGKTRYED
jgi:ribosome-associated protein